MSRKTPGFSSNNHCLSASLVIASYTVYYCIHPMSMRLHEYIGYHGLYRLLLFGNWQSFKNFVTLWNFNNGKIIKCAISWKRLAVEQNGRKFRTRSTRKSMCRIFFGSGHLSSVWGHSLHFAKLLMLRFSKGCCSPSFYPVFNQTLQKACIQGKYRLVPILSNRWPCTLFRLLTRYPHMSW